MRFVVLGGSSPFTAGLINAMAECSLLSPGELVLFGRNKHNLDTIFEYATNKLELVEWKISISIDLFEALSGADVVLHQIRYGDLDGRMCDEEFSHQWNLLSDETLGPSAFHSLISMIPSLKKISTTLAEVCPKAWVLNLTNPLSIVTKLMIDFGVSRCMGLCELPFTTACQVAESFNLPINDVDWSYIGFNHRGFLVKFNYMEKDYIREYLHNFGSHLTNGIPAETVESMDVIPTKYFRLFFGFNKANKINRSGFLTQVRREIITEINQSPNTCPPSLKKRNLDWYSHAVVPMLVALNSTQPRLRVANLLSPDGIVEEYLVKISKSSLKICKASQNSIFVEHWVNIFKKHEFALLNAIYSPSLETFTNAVNCDPIIPEENIDGISKALWDVYQKQNK